MLEEIKTKLETEKQQLENEKIELQKKLEAKAIQAKAQVRLASTKKVVAGDCLAWMNEAGISDIQNAYILIMRESGCRVNATNRSSGAYGIPQSLPASKMASYGADYLTNPITQLRWMENYVAKRYGSWANAVAHSNQCGWY